MVFARTSGFFETREWIVSRLTIAAENDGLRIPAPNALVDMSMRVAMTLAYLAQERGFISVAALFCVAKSTGFLNVNEVMDFSIAIAPKAIHFPSNMAGWSNISKEFEENCGFPDVAGAIDVSLF